jgi:hypothetical protein
MIRSLLRLLFGWKKTPEQKERMMDMLKVQRFELFERVHQNLPEHLRNSEEIMRAIAEQIAGAVIQPKRVSGRSVVSAMLLSLSPDAEALISADLGRSLSSQLDRAIYYGTGGGDEPMGIKADSGTHKLIGITSAN